MTTYALDPVRHERILMDMEHIRSVANIPLEYLQNSMVKVCTPAEVDWVRNFHTHRATKAGLVLSGVPDSEAHCLAITGALVRNFVDARVMPLNTALQAIESNTLPDPTVMVIPNFYQKSFGKTLPAWKVSALYDLLLSRFTSGRPTVIAVEDLASMEQGYGPFIVDHLKTHYIFA